MLQVVVRRLFLVVFAPSLPVMHEDGVVARLARWLVVP
jgi:hypothetical protein